MVRAKKNPAPPASGHGADTSGEKSTPRIDTNQVGQQPTRYAAICRRAIFDSAISAPALRVLAALACYTDRQHRCRPSVPTIAKRLGISDRMVQYHLRDLAAAGYIEQQMRTGLATFYTLRYPDEPVETEPPEEADRCNPISPGGETPFHQGVKPDFTRGVKPHFTQTILIELPQGTTKGTKTLVQPAADTFDAWWKAYPRREGKGHARRAYAAALKKAPAAVLLAAAQRYAIERANEPPRFTKLPTTWLNGECWLDEAAPAMPAKPGRGRGDVGNAAAVFMAAIEDEEAAA